MSRRLVDVAVALVGLVLLWPLLAAAALAILLADGRPVIFRAARVGLDGRRFTMLKLRTMRSRPRSAAGDSLITGVADPRVFRVGSWLRRTKVDELPQLVNILLGEMSIV